MGLGSILKYTAPGIGNYATQKSDEKEEAENIAKAPKAPAKKTKKKIAPITSDTYNKRTTAASKSAAAKRSKLGGKQSTIMTTSDKLGG